MQVDRMDIDPAADRGNCGVEADYSWACKWSQWSREQVDHYFAATLDFGPLSRNQVIQLLDGFPPEPPGWSTPTTILDSNAPLLARFDADVARKAIGAQPTVSELAAWCDYMNHELPEAIVEALKNQPVTPKLQQSNLKLDYPPWLCPPIDPCPVPITPSKKKTRGRPKTSEYETPRILKRGEEILMESARAGKLLSLKDIAKQLHNEGLAPTMHVTSLVARLKGRMPVQSAKHCAAMAIQKTASAR